MIFDENFNIYQKISEIKNSIFDSISDYEKIFFLRKTEIGDFSEKIKEILFLIKQNLVQRDSLKYTLSENALAEDMMKNWQREYFMYLIISNPEPLI